MRILNFCMAVAAISLTFGAVKGEAADDTLRSRYQVKKTVLYTFKGKEYPINITVSADRMQVALGIKNKSKRYVWSEKFGKSKSYESIYGINFSPDGSRLAFTAPKKNHIYVIVDNKQYGPFNTILSDSVVFSPNSKRFAFAAGYKASADDREDLFIVLDGVRGPKYNTISMEPPRFGPNSERFIYFVRHKGKRFAVLDGNKGQEFEDTGWGPFFSYDGSIVVYLGFRNDSGYIVVNDSAIGGYYGLADPALSPSSLDIAYAGYKDSGSIRQVHINHEPTDGYYASKDPTFNSDGSRFAFWASNGGKQFAVVDSIEDTHYENISDIRFSSDGKHYYYIVYYDMDPNRWAFVVDGKLLTEMTGDLSNPKIYFAPDGSRLAYVWDVDSLDEKLIIDGTEIEGNVFNDLIFSPDGKRYAVLRQTDVNPEWQLLLDGKEIIYDEFIAPNVDFSPNSKDVAFFVNNDDGRYLVINDEKFETFGNIYPMKVQYIKDGSIVYYAVKDNNFYRVVVSPTDG